MAAPQSTGTDPARTTLPTVPVDDNTTNEGEKSSLKKKLWPFGKKKDDKKEDKSAESGLTSTYPARSTSPAPAAGMSAPTSPSQRVDSSSPRVASPASSQIFERNVQEESLAPSAVPAAIPSHIATENHIPPALDAASETITNQKLDPDSVEIVTHVAHQPAAVSVAQGTGAGSISGIAPSTAGVLGGESLAAVAASPSLPATSEEAASVARSVPTTTSGPGVPAAEAKNAATTLDDGASSYGDLNPTDVRRLSFISFADVVHHEQAQSIGSETASQLPAAGAASPAIGSTLLPSPVPGSSAPGQLFSPALSAASPVMSPSARSPSPVRAISPPMRAASPNFLSANAASPKIVGGSPSPPTGVSGELAVETMGQALRKTGSGDLSAARDRHATEAVEGLGVR